MQFTSDQQYAADKLGEFLSQSKYRTFYLFGQAGTGKTYLIGNRIRDWLDKYDRNICICSPTHKALNVIKSNVMNVIGADYFANEDCKISFRTLHNKLNFRAKISAIDGSRTFVSKVRKSKTKTLDIILVDECSMISSKMAASINSYMDNSVSKIVYMGDSMQLPPVGEKISRIFSEIDDTYPFQATLSTIVRTKHKSIQAVCTAIREWDKKESIYLMLKPIYSNRKDTSFKMYRDSSLDKNGTPKWINHFVNDINLNMKSIIITWDNSTASYYNNLTRKCIHNNQAMDAFIENDCIMFNDYYHTSSKSHVFHTSDMARILSRETTTTKLGVWKKHTIDNPSNRLEKTFNTLLRKLDKITNEYTVIKIDIVKLGQVCAIPVDEPIQTVDTADMDRFQSDKTNIENHITDFYAKTKSEKLADILWQAYYEYYIDPFAAISFGYGITTYKSQGSTYDSVYVHMQNMGTVRDLDDFHRALYTAVGRASEKLCLIV